DALTVEVNAGVTALSGGETVEQLAAGTTLLGSPEYFQARGGGTTEGFLSAIFLDLLHRAIDPPTRAQLVAAIHNGASRSDVAALVLSSGEYRAALATNFIMAFLGRAPTAGEVAPIVDRIAHGETDQGVISDILSSPEYFMRATSDIPSGTPFTAVVAVLFDE